MVFSIVGVTKAGTTPGFAVLLVALGTIVGVVMAITVTAFVLLVRFALRNVIGGVAIDVASCVIASLLVAGTTYLIALSGQREWGFWEFVLPVAAVLAVTSVAVLTIVRYRGSSFTATMSRQGD